MKWEAHKGLPRCYYCGCTTPRSPAHARSLSQNPDQVLTQDHIKARAFGGTQTVDCCWRCNQAKADGCPEEFKQFAAVFLIGKSPRVGHRDALIGFRAWSARAIF